MQVIPYLFFNGQCADAIAFYEQSIGASVAHKMLGSDMPPDPNFTVSDDKKNWILHAAVIIGDNTIMMSDSFMQDSASMDGAAVMLSYSSAEEARVIFNALLDGGEVTMPFDKTFWSAGFGTLRDKFGVCWMVGCDEAPS